MVYWRSCAPFCGLFFRLLRSPASLPLTWGVGSECFSTSCGQLQGPPRTRCWCWVLLCLSCRHSWSAAMGGIWFSFQMLTLDKKCLWGCGQPPCGVWAGWACLKGWLGTGPRRSTLSCQDMPRMWQVFFRWKELSLFSCLAYVVYVSLPYISVLTTQALYTAILVFTVSLGLVALVKWGEQVLWVTSQS